MLRAKFSCLLLLASMSASGAQAETVTVEEVLFEAPCGAAIKAAIAHGNADDSIFRDDEKEVAYAFILGLGANDARPGNEKEVFGRGIGAAYFYCERNVDASLFEIGRLVGKE